MRRGKDRRQKRRRVQHRVWETASKGEEQALRVWLSPVGSGVDKVQEAVDAAVHDGLAVQARLVLEVLEEGVVEILDQRRKAVSEARKEGGGSSGDASGSGGEQGTEPHRCSRPHKAFRSELSSLWECGEKIESRCRANRARECESDI